MSHAKFKQIKETANILADHIFWLRSMGFYELLNLVEQGKELEHFMFDGLPIISAKLKC